MIRVLLNKIYWLKDNKCKRNNRQRVKCREKLKYDKILE